MYKNYVKRLIDIFISLLVLVVFSWLYIILTIVGFIALEGNPFFLQERPGYKEKIFKLIKFRTMKNGEGADEERLTKYGKFLRSTSLDELPEFINILTGDMSLVGPRPLLVRYLPYYTERERKRHSVRPGLTGLAQINGRNNLNWVERLELDVKYTENLTSINDIKILLKTVLLVIKKSDITTDGKYIMKDFDEERKEKIDKAN